MIYEFSGGEGGRGFSGGMGDILDDLDVPDTGCCLLTILLLPIYGLFALIENLFDDALGSCCLGGGCFGSIATILIILFLIYLLFGSILM